MREPLALRGVQRRLERRAQRVHVGAEARIGCADDLLIAVHGPLE
jgi:hypothetical protein